MNFSSLVRQHWAALRALLVLTVIVGIGYPLFIWLVGQIPGLNDKANGSIIESGGKPVGSSLIGQAFTDDKGTALPQYFQSRPSAAGDGYDPLSTSASNLGPESIVDSPDKPSLLTQVCTRSKDIGELNGVDGARPFCTGGGVGAVLSVIGPRDASGTVVHPTTVVSINEPCDTTARPFLDSYEGVQVQCAKPGEDYAVGQIVPVKGAVRTPVVPADAVTASGSGLDPNISPAYADLQIARVAKARGVGADQIQALVAQYTDGRTLGFFGEPRVNVLKLNIALDEKFGAKS
ncbi:K+-transporting ATPase ATPase C chain [Mycolicibacterium sp. BK556]|uniref:potassium-transporting ATPase subunit C n=1 Tax=Mycobacteriaceae TaxID=1762 RepID=UPI0010614ED5|nr:MULTISPECIES: potassium-transporting ATPase subunit C [Mycobacteriaceae]MBB3602201.1 K+-transporting ATPase ATPase C chain [Mycolicibacterium sp. BK556]MBB3631953.1 K+-transporting ATPase ATPase C chain [Mycolicibacterium sp. BK607]MBB3749972.1 K+-transporting ATPase ATPase C chain [Mycolicibacterium sp. BK634]TDO18756.1 K+-transporting ATPase ATPase C chain [Mycobacterium sp. BK086]